MAGRRGGRFSESKDIKPFRSKHAHTWDSVILNPKIIMDNAMVNKTAALLEHSPRDSEQGAPAVLGTAATSAGALHSAQEGCCQLGQFTASTTDMTQMWKICLKVHDNLKPGCLI